MISIHSATHSLQMNTPGPATIACTSAVGFTQKVQATDGAGLVAVGSVLVAVGSVLVAGTGVPLSSGLSG
jgi:hypothetical protein